MFAKIYTALELLNNLLEEILNCNSEKVSALIIKLPFIEISGEKSLISVEVSYSDIKVPLLVYILEGYIIFLSGLIHYYCHVFTRLYSEILTLLQESRNVYLKNLFEELKEIDDQKRKFITKVLQYEKDLKYLASQTFEKDVADVRHIIEELKYIVERTLQICKKLENGVILSVRF